MGQSMDPDSRGNDTLQMNSTETTPSSAGLEGTPLAREERNLPGGGPETPAPSIPLPLPPGPGEAPSPRAEGTHAPRERREAPRHRKRQDGRPRSGERRGRGRGGQRGPRPPGGGGGGGHRLPPEEYQKVRQVLSERFGFTSFRGVQEPVVCRLVGGHNALVIMPTGGGKSLCYQLPALVREGTALILSPLIALMKDQVDALRAKGIGAGFINSSLTPRERGARRSAFVKGAYEIVYVTPERFSDPNFVEACSKVKISLLAVDEAHCISQWGHDFRPAYRKIGEIRKLLGNPPTLALTATATRRVQRDVRKTLGFADRQMPLFHTGIERPNLRLEVKEAYGDGAKLEAIEEVITKRHPESCGVVYFSRITDLDRLGDQLLSKKIPFERYHGKMHPYRRKVVQEKFIKGEVKLLFATNAFGMGIDKPDIRFVIHAQMPRNVESYYQEIGRAGRDGQPSTCLLLYDPDDLAIQQEFIEWANPDADFIYRVENAIANHPAGRQPLSLEEIGDRLVHKTFIDPRFEYALTELESLGVVESVPPINSSDPERWLYIRSLEVAEIDPKARVKKKRKDLLQLFELNRYIKSRECRRAFLYQYFFEKPRPADDCHASCDICVHGPNESLAGKEKPKRRRPGKRQEQEARRRPIRGEKRGGRRGRFGRRGRPQPGPRPLAMPAGPGAPGSEAAGTSLVPGQEAAARLGEPPRFGPEETPGSGRPQGPPGGGGPPQRGGSSSRRRHRRRRHGRPHEPHREGHPHDPNAQKPPGQESSHPGRAPERGGPPGEDGSGEQRRRRRRRRRRRGPWNPSAQGASGTHQDQMHSSDQGSGRETPPPLPPPPPLG